MTTLGRHPDALAVKLTLGDGAHLVASTLSGWAGPVTLHYGPKTGAPAISDPGTVDGDEVSWTLTEAEVTARAEHDWARLEDNGVTLAAGPVMTWLGGSGHTVTQTIASLTAGPPGPTAVSADPDNVAIISPNDGLIYVSPADAGGFSDAAVAAFVADEGSDTYAAITALQPDLSGYVETTDPRLSDARTPTVHAASHASGGTDPVTPASIGAATPSQVSSGDSATLAAAQSHAQGLVDALTAASPATLDTLAEIADALGEDPNFAATMTAALAARVRHDAAQSLTVGEQAQARSNIGAGTSSFSGDYGDLDNKPTLGDAAAKNTGTTAGTVAAGDDSRITGAIPSGLVDAKGDLIVGTADNTVTRLPASTDGHVLTLDSAQAAGVKWAAPSGGGGGGSAVPLGPGVSIPSIGAWRLAGYVVGGFGDQALTLTRILMVPLDVDTASAVDGLAVRVTTGAASGVIRLGLYAATSDGAPGSLVAGTEQTVDASTSGIKEATFTKVNLAPGRYWIAYVGQGAAATGRFYTTGLIIPASATSVLLPSGTATIVGYRGSTTAAGALPSTISLAADAYGNAPLIAVRLVTQ